MRHPEYSTVDPNNGNVTYSGPLEIQKGTHANMPARTEVYLPGDERGHVTASSLGGTNSTANVVAQHHDVNQAFVSMEQGERNALQNAATIQSDKTAVVNGQPGDRPEVFMVTDNVTYPDGHNESVHLSFTNASNVEQEAWNAQAAELPDFDEPNPGDGLRDSMPAEEYADLMEATDADLPGIEADYAPADYCGISTDEAISDAADGAVANDSTADFDADSIAADAGAAADAGDGIGAEPD